MRVGQLDVGERRIARRVAELQAAQRRVTAVAIIRLRCVFESAGTTVHGAQGVPVAAIVAL